MAKKSPQVTITSEAPEAPMPPEVSPELVAQNQYDQERSAFFDANVADKALKSNASELPVFDEPNLPHDRDVLQNYTAPQVVTTDNGMGRVEGTGEKEPSAEVVRPI